MLLGSVLLVFDLAENTTKPLKEDMPSLVYNRNFICQLSDDLGIYNVAFLINRQNPKLKLHFSATKIRNAKELRYFASRKNAVHVTGYYQLSFISPRG